MTGHDRRVTAPKSTEPIREATFPRITLGLL